MKAGHSAFVVPKRFGLAASATTDYPVPSLPYPAIIVSGCKLSTGAVMCGIAGFVLRERVAEHAAVSSCVIRFVTAGLTMKDIMSMVHARWVYAV